jgi:general stress protein 26
MRWTDLQERQPRLGRLAHDRLVAPGVLLVVTIRGDGTPRLSPVEPFVHDGELWLSMMLGSRKAADLHRDPRVLVHSVVTGPSGEEGEIKLRGTAVPHDDEPTHERYAGAVTAALPWSPEVGKFHLFAVDIEQATYIRYDNATGDQHVAIWPPAKEFWRRATSATSVGEEEPVHDLLQ